MPAFQSNGFRQRDPREGKAGTHLPPSPFSAASQSSMPNTPFTSIFSVNLTLVNDKPARAYRPEGFLERRENKETSLQLRSAKRRRTFVRSLSSKLFLEVPSNASCSETEGSLLKIIFEFLKIRLL